jgi:hypothetical protein
VFRPQAYPYNWKGFKQCLSLTFLLAGFFGPVTWFLAPEEVSCHRHNGAATCTLTRKVWNIGVYQRTIHEVTDAVVMDPPPNHHDDDSGPVYRVHLLSRTTDLEAVGVDDRENAEHAAQAVKAFLSGSQSPLVQAELNGQPGAGRTIALYAFAFGLALVPLWLIGYFLPFTRPY